MTSDIVKWGDSAQFHQDRGFTKESSPGTDDGSQGVVPTVRLLSMTPDPLGAIAAMYGMYGGKVVRHLHELDDDYRRMAWDNVLKTHLNTPLEAVQLHFLLEGVDRAFTHQLVRQRVGAAYAQESLRFAVVDDLLNATTLPPSLHGTWTTKTEEGFKRLREEGPMALADKPQRWRNTWDDAIEAVDRAYRLLVDSGMPAEEARGLLPHATATRVHYVTNLRALADHAGNRLCTQAQFIWRKVFANIIDAIRRHDPYQGEYNPHERWQYETIADSALFRPICYSLGRCPFKAEVDRACSIRGRVDAFQVQGVPSDQWDKGFKKIDLGNLSDQPRSKADVDYVVKPIKPAEWLANPAAARS